MQKVTKRVKFVIESFIIINRNLNAGSKLQKNYKKYQKIH